MYTEANPPRLSGYARNGGVYFSPDYKAQASPPWGSPMTRVAVFIDYQNAYMRARESFGNPRSDPYTFGQLHPLLLGTLLNTKGLGVDPARELEQVRVYRGEPDATVSD